MLIFFMLVFLLLSMIFLKSYSWLSGVSSFFLMSFVGIFCLHSYGWETSYLLFSNGLVGVSLVVLSVWLGGLMLLANWAVFLHKNYDFGFKFMVVSLIFVLVVCFSVSNFFYFYVFFELSLVPTFILILGWGYQPERLGASMYMVMYTVGASLPLLSCFLYFYNSFGHLSFYLPFSLEISGFYQKVLFFMLMLAFLVKIPVFFVHLWLPKAHVEAPVAGSMILAGVLLKLGGYGMMQVVKKLGGILSCNSIFYMSFVLWGGVITALICLRQVDLKALIAYSSIGHMGVFVAGVMTNNVWGVQGGLMMLLGHGLCSPALFALANINYESIGSRSMLLTKGLLSVFPFLSFLWFLLCSSNMAAPPSLNLGSEMMLFVSVLGMNWFFGIFFGLASFLAGAYSLYLYTSSQHGQLTSCHLSYLPVKVRSYFLVLCHWVPLNVLFLSLGLLADWV